MYIDTYIAIVLWIFAIFGFIYFISLILRDIYIACRRKGSLAVIITAKNQQDVIEGIVRGFILKSGVEGTEDSLINITLVDMNSCDDTPKVMERLAGEYCYIKFVKPGELGKYMANLMDNSK